MKWVRSLLDRRYHAVTYSPISQTFAIVRKYLYRKGLFDRERLQGYQPLTRGMHFFFFSLSLIIPSFLSCPFLPSLSRSFSSRGNPPARQSVQGLLRRSWREGGQEACREVGRGGCHPAASYTFARRRPAAAVWQEVIAGANCGMHIYIVCPYVFLVVRYRCLWRIILSCRSYR